MPYTNPLGMTYDSGDYGKVMDRALALADWDGLRARRRAEARSAAGCAASASPTTSSATGAFRASAPRSPCIRKAASMS